MELKNWNPVTEGSDGRVTGKPGGSLGASWQWKPGWHSAPPHQSCQVALLNPHHHSSHLDARNPPPWADPVGMHAAGSLLHHLPALPAPTLLFTSNLGPEAPCLELATNAMQSGSQVLQLFRTQRPFPCKLLVLTQEVWHNLTALSLDNRHDNLLMRSLEKLSQRNYLNFRFKDHLLLKDH